MHASGRSPVDAGLAELLAVSIQHHRAQDEIAFAAAAEAIGAERLSHSSTLLGALALGGIDFATRLLGAPHPELPDSQRHVLLIDAFNQMLESPVGSSQAEHEEQLAHWLVAQFQLSVPAASVLDHIRADFLISVGPLEDVRAAALTAMRHRQWETALRGLQRCRDELKSKATADVYGMGAMCLHKLGRYAEADQWTAQGLGPRASQMAIGPVFTEAELRHRWSGRLAPVVSIICTTYNHERYIEQALRGFLSQDCPYAFEILIHDDASTDGTQAIIRKWQAEYPRVIKAVLQTQNQYSRGVRPFELMLAKARGQYVATCEGDDFWVMASKLKRQVDFLQENPDYACCAHNYYHFVEATLSVEPWIKHRRELVMSKADLMRISRLLWLPTLVFRKTFSSLPPERAESPIGDQFLTSFLGTQGKGMYFEAMMAAVRRENEFSTWSPLASVEKEKIRIKTWAALVRLHRRLGNPEAVKALEAKIAASELSCQQEAEASGA